MHTSIRFLALSSSLLIGVFPGCEDAIIPSRIAPSVTLFTANPGTILEGEAVQFVLHAATEIGLVHGIVDYRDGTKRDTVSLSGISDSGHTSHVFLVPGTYAPTLTVEDASGQVTIDSTIVHVRPDQLPQVVSRLTGAEGAISRIARKVLANDPEGDSLSILVSPVSPGLVFQFNSANDSVIYYLTNRDENGLRQGKITVVDEKNRIVEKIVDIQFAPRDDIGGHVFDRFEGTYLAGYRPAVVLQGPFTGWVSAITGGETVTVPVDANGRYVLPKLTTGNHTLRACITNGSDSSFVATYQVSSGDQTFDLKVETNAGTGMPLGRLLSLYQTANFRVRYAEPWNSFLAGMNLKNGASEYAYYLIGKEITSTWLNAKSFTPEQQNWLGNEIQTRCFAHLPPANRPRIVHGVPNDPVPLRSGSINGLSAMIPYRGYILVYANLLETMYDALLTLWDEFYDGVYDCARIALNGGNVTSPPYGFSMIALVQKVGKSISGDGTVLDQYYNDKTTRAENTILDMPSIADMKLDWQVVFESPKYNNNVEARYFEMPE